MVVVRGEIKVKWLGGMRRHNLSLVTHGNWRILGPFSISSPPSLPSVEENAC